MVDRQVFIVEEEPTETEGDEDDNLAYVGILVIIGGGGTALAWAMRSRQGAGKEVPSETPEEGSEQDEVPDDSGPEDE